MWESSGRSDQAVLQNGRSRRDRARQYDRSLSFGCGPLVATRAICFRSPRNLLQEKRALVDEIEPESRAAEQFTSGAVTERVADRREAALITAYLEFRRASALPRLRRLKIKPAGEVQPLFTDLYDP